MIQSRVSALSDLAVSIEAERENLLHLLIQTTGRTHATAWGEIQLAIDRLRAFPSILPLLMGRQGVGTVGILFPSNAALSNPVATIGTAYLAGNRVIARFPGALGPWAAVVEALITRHLDGVRFDHGPGPAFLEGLIADPAVPVIIAFGDDGWATQYEGSIRASGTTFIFEGPGKDPFVVLPDADLPTAAAHAVQAGTFNAGQACTSPERFYVHESLATEFLALVTERLQALRGWDPTDPGTTLGPIFNPRVVERIRAQLDEARAAGAKLLTGGAIREVTMRDGRGAWWVEPTLLTGVDHRLGLMREETFGPILPVQVVKSPAEAIELAADSPYGLAASLFGGSPAERGALEQSHGVVFQDETWLTYYRRLLHAPYGGRKRSGWTWTTQAGQFLRLEGPRTNALLFSQPER